MQRQQIIVCSRFAKANATRLAWYHVLQETLLLCNTLLGDLKGEISIAAPT